MTRSSKMYSFSNPNRKRVHPDLGDEILTKQSFKDECDVNHIIAKFEATGFITSVNNKTPVYGDVSSSMSLKKALDTVNEAKLEFASLTKEQRKLFKDDFRVYCDFLAIAPEVDFDNVNRESSTARSDKEDAKDSPSAEPSET